MSLLESLEKLVDIWESKGVPMRQHLRPGLTRAEIQAALMPLGLVPPEELYELYQWHDGLDDWEKPGGMLFGEHKFISLEFGISHYYDTLKYYILDDIEDEYNSLYLKQSFPFAFLDGSSYNI